MEASFLKAVTRSRLSGSQHYGDQKRPTQSSRWPGKIFAQCLRLGRSKLSPASDLQIRPLLPILKSSFRLHISPKMYTQERFHSSSTTDHNWPCHLCTCLGGGTGEADHPKATNGPRREGGGQRGSGGGCMACVGVREVDNVTL